MKKETNVLVRIEHYIKEGFEYCHIELRKSVTEKLSLVSNGKNGFQWEENHNVLRHSLVSIVDSRLATQVGGLVKVGSTQIFLMHMFSQIFAEL